MSVHVKKAAILLLPLLLLFSPLLETQAALPKKTSALKETVSKTQKRSKVKKQRSSKQAVISRSRLLALKKAQKKLRKTSLSLEKSIRAKEKKLLMASNQAEMETLNHQISSYLLSQGLNTFQWSVYVKNLSTNCSTVYNHRPFYSASTIKLFAMSAAYQKIHNGQLSMTSDLRNKLYNMIVYSDNDSFNSIVLDYLGEGYVTSHAQKLGLPHTTQCNSLSPGSHPYISYPKYGSNQTCAEDCGLLLEKIYRKKLISKSASLEMENLLKQQNNRSKIPSGIPSGVPVANKTGETSSYQHDTAIVYAEETPYIICIFSERAPNSYFHIRNLSSLVYHFLNG